MKPSNTKSMVNRKRKINKKKSHRRYRSVKTFHIVKSKESWKIVPKDSCEVYKKRFRRNAQRKRGSSDDSSDFSSQDRGLKRTRGVKNNCKCKTCRQNRRFSSGSSQSSITNSERSESISTTKTS